MAFSHVHPCLPCKQNGQDPILSAPKTFSFIILSNDFITTECSFHPSFLCNTAFKSTVGVNLLKADNQSQQKTGEKVTRLWKTNSVFLNITQNHNKSFTFAKVYPTSVSEKIACQERHIKTQQSVTSPQILSLWLLIENTCCVYCSASSLTTVLKKLLAETFFIKCDTVHDLDI